MKDPIKLAKRAKRKEDMEYLRNELNYSINGIAKEFGLSKSRISQIIGIKNVSRRRKKKQALKSLDKTSNLTNKEFAELFDLPIGYVVSIRSKNRHAMSGNPKMGKDIEDFVSAKLSEYGIANDLMPFHNKFDILAKNGAKIEVKSCWRGKLFGRGTTPGWRFRIKEEPNDIDFYVCVIVSDTKELFIIPNAVVKGRAQIRFCYPSEYWNAKKYLKYHNNFDLIKNFQK